MTSHSTSFMPILYEGQLAGDRKCLKEEVMQEKYSALQTKIIRLGAFYIAPWVIRFSEKIGIFPVQLWIHGHHPNHISFYSSDALFIIDTCNLSSYWVFSNLSVKCMYGSTYFLISFC